MQTKIVSTIGPASAARDRVHALAEIGVDVFRLNFAHGSHDDHRQVVGWVREASRECGRPLAILADLAGPKIRIGAMPGPVQLVEHAHVVIAPEGEHEGDELPTSYHQLARDVRPGDRVLLDDGLMELRVDRVDDVRVHCTVLRGGLLQQKKGLNLPGVRVSAPALTEKDIEDLEFAISQGVDFIGLSFVQTADDVLNLRRRLPAGMQIVAKIEKDTALEQIESILEATDAVMVARGDLGVELPFEKVPMAQKRIIRLANLYGRPVITATQMLESMINHPRPTRAEASDVANALFDGTDAVMLSGETATGRYPYLAVEAMVRIATEIEQSPHYTERLRYHVGQESSRSAATPTEHAIAAATVAAVQQVQAAAVVTFTITGGTTRVVASYRPPVPIVGMCDLTETAQQLTLVWGVHPVLCPSGITYEQMLGCARSYLIGHHLATPGQRVVVTAGAPFHVAGTTNMLRIEEL